MLTFKAFERFIGVYIDNYNVCFVVLNVCLWVGSG